MTRYPVVSIIGRPNVGKSTLFNKIIGRRIAIVEEEPGVTRDRHHYLTSINDQEFLLIDTGGIEFAGSDEMTEQITKQAEIAIEESDIIIFLLDGRDGLNPTDEDIARLLRRTTKKTLFAVNKIDGDGQQKDVLQFYKLAAEELYPISAKRNYCLNAFLKTLSNSLISLGITIEKTSDPDEDIPKISVIGRPNGGKSTLINQILGEERLITSEIPGTTRDSIDIQVEHKNSKYIFIDTAGIKRRGKALRGVEHHSTIRSITSLLHCDISILVLNGEEGVTAQDKKILGNILQYKKGVILVVNKSDLLPPEKRDKITKDLNRMIPFANFAPVIFISAKEGWNIIGLFKILNKIWRSVNYRVGTGELNRIFTKLITSHKPPLYKKKPIKLLYVTQTNTRPPTFVIFANKKDGVQKPYIRYIENSLRDKFNFYGTPIDLIIKEKDSKYTRKSKR